jgi:hypothetical protein
MGIKKLEGLITKLSTYIDKKDCVNENVSKANVGWHVEHSFLVVSKISEALKQSNPANYQWKFNVVKTLVYTLNKIPRGKGKAPKTVLPNDVITIENLNTFKVNALVKISELNSLSKNNFFPHPYFGNLNLPETIKFLNIHTQHHLNIINDILTK